MNVAKAVREIYEKWPYPDLHPSGVAKRYWLLPPLPWIKAIWRREQPIRRILIAGCGTGSECFAACRKFRNAEIVAIDFSPRSIKTAKNLQSKNPKFQNIRFLLCDLTDRRMPKIVGDNFDLVSCHGVLSYVPHNSQVLRNLARCLATGGLLYLGVNGENHPSRRWRQV